MGPRVFRSVFGKVQVSYLNLASWAFWTVFSRFPVCTLTCWVPFCKGPKNDPIGPFQLITSSAEFWPLALAMRGCSASASANKFEALIAAVAEATETLVTETTVALAAAAARLAMFLNDDATLGTLPVLSLSESHSS